MNNKIEEIKRHITDGFLFRTDDGVQPYGVENVIDDIKNLKLDGDLSGSISNQGPPYSFSGIFTNAPPFIWYNHEYSDPFWKKGDEPKKQYDRTIVGIIPKKDKILISGGCIWDADSDLRNLGTIPLRPFDEATGLNEFSNLSPFDGIGGFQYSKPTTNNNNSSRNPMITPWERGEVAETKESVTKYIKDLGSLKEAYFKTMLKNADGYSNKFAKYINENWGLGVESEILGVPKNRTTYWEKRFDASDIAAIVFFQDAMAVESSPKYAKAAQDFLTNIKGTWLTNESDLKAEDLPILLVKEALLPEVPLDANSGNQNSSLGDEINNYGSKGQVKPFDLKQMHILTSNNQWMPVSDTSETGSGHSNMIPVDVMTPTQPYTGSGPSNMMEGSTKGWSKHFAM
jgi:hypothetical protein